TVDGTHTRAGLRTITTLNTGEGNDRVTVSLDAATDGFFVVNTQGGDDTVNAAGATVPVPVGPGTITLPASTVPLVIFGGLGRDTIDGGEGADIIFGDLGRVHYYSGGQLVTRLGGGGPGDLTDGVIRTPDPTLNLNPNLPGNDGVTPARGGNDYVAGHGGADLIFGGGNDVRPGDSPASAESLAGDAANDVILGDFGMITLVSGGMTRI